MGQILFVLLYKRRYFSMQALNDKRATFQMKTKQIEINDKKINPWRISFWKGTLFLAGGTSSDKMEIE